MRCLRAFGYSDGKALSYYKPPCGVVQVFVLLSGGEEKYVAPGLKLPVVLQYSPKGDDEASHGGSLEVFVNSSLSLTIPISVLVHLMWPFFISSCCT